MIQEINKAVQSYFQNNTDAHEVPVKVIASILLERKVLDRNHAAGLKLRQLLKKLDRQNRLDEIPFVFPLRKEQYTYWYFKRQT